MANISMWEPVGTIRNDFEKLFSDFFPASVKKFWGYEPGLIEPAVNMSEKEGMIVVKVELPGITKDDVKLEIHDNRLTIKGERKTEKEEKKEDYYMKEIAFGSFHRIIELPYNVDESSASASMKDGVMEITMKKTEPAKPIEISVK